MKINTHSRLPEEYDRGMLYHLFLKIDDAINPVLEILADGDKGDITVSSSGAAWTVDNDAITFAKMQNITTARLLGRATAGSGNTEEIALGTGLSFTGTTLNATGGSVTHTGGALTANAVVLGAGTDDVKVVAGVTTDGTSALNLGVAGTSVGKVVLANATSGTISVQPPAGALGTVTVTIPATTGTVALRETANVFTKNQSVTPVALTASTTVTVDVSLSNNFKLTPTSNFTLANPTNLTDGMIVNIRFKQGATPYTIAYGTKFKFPGGTAAALTASSSAIDFLSMYYDSTDDRLECVMNKRFF